MKVTQFQKAFSAFLFASHLEAKTENPSDKALFAKESVQKGIDHLLGRDSASTDWSTTQETRENYDVTFEIPIVHKGGENLVISSNWNLV